MKRNRSAAAIRMAELFVRALLADLDKAQMLQRCHDFARLEYRQGPASHVTQP